MRQTVNVLIVEDNEHDAALLVRELSRGGLQPRCERVDTAVTMAEAIRRSVWDIVIADYSMPQFNAKDALRVIAHSGVDIPCIVVSGSVGEETAVDVMHAGALDLVLKSNLKRLRPAVMRELEAARARRGRRMADAELDRERQLLRQLMKEIPDAICFKDIERRYTRLNEAERAILNVSSESEAIGKTVETLASPALAQARRTDEERVLATGEPLVDCVEQIAGPDGKLRWLSATKAPIRDPEGDVVGLVEIARDITESKRQDQLKNEFVATVSHELRTPLTSIMGSIGFIVGSAAGRLPDTVMRALEIALGNCRRLVAIVDDILDLETIESGCMRYERKHIEVQALVDQAIQAHLGSAQQYGVTVRLDTGSAQAVLLTDADRLIQVITILLSNAVKFTACGTEVVMWIESGSGLVRINVRDRGPGIPDDYKERIFDKFVQVDATDQRTRGGPGLGLSIAKQIVAQLDGVISFEPAPGGGSTFTLTFPAADPVDIAAEQISNSPSVSPDAASGDRAAIGSVR